MDSDLPYTNFIKRIDGFGLAGDEMTGSVVEDLDVVG
jgi:hypothetical protein